METSTLKSNDDIIAFLSDTKNTINKSDNEVTKSLISSITNPTTVHTELSDKVGVFGVLLTIVGTIIGGAIVGIPYATLKTGIWIMLGLHLLNFVWGVYSVYLLLEAKNISGLASFSELGYKWLNWILRLQYIITWLLVFLNASIFHQNYPYNLDSIL